MKKITRSQLESQPVPVPTRSEQELLVRTLDAEMAIAKRVRQAAEGELAALKALPAALLRQAFSGEL